MTLSSYLPQDRLRALSHGKTLPDRTGGSALFADLSGFTALSESLRGSLGVRRGAEEISKQLGTVFSALIAEVEKYGGSVIGFAGDAMTCWFDAGPEGSKTGACAAACAFGMQSAVRSFPALGLKVAIASGEARRFVVGDPEIQRIDALAGVTVARVSTAEHHALQGDVLADEATIAALGDHVLIKEWRADPESGERFASLASFMGGVLESRLEPIEILSDELLKNWVPGEVFERQTSHQGVFLTEFRPCVALFVRFTGIDYDSEAAEGELDAFVRQVQKTTQHYAGMLMDITIGDKGSYIYINLGAVSTHEDDARRAIKTALELRSKTDLQLQMGITQGVMCVGAYGGTTRKTFGALGDDVNLAARLMTIASPGEILVSGHVHQAAAHAFAFEPRPPLPVKGKAEPLPVFSVTGESRRRSVRLQEPTYALPMVGRQDELQVIHEKLDLALQGRGQVVGIVAEAGLGKSRLVAEVIRSARRKGFVGYGGACQSDGTHTPYLPWRSIWQAFFDVDPELPFRKQLRNIEGEIEDRAPARLDALPLLSAVLDLKIPDNEFTKTLEPRFRQSALHALLEDCLKAAAQEDPLLIVIEDLHWIDALSHDLLEGLAQALANSAVCFVLAYRPPQLERLQGPPLEALPGFTRIELHELNEAEMEAAIRAKLAQLYPARSGAVSARLAETLMARSQGNPFYLEELLNYLRDRGLDPREPSALERIELPDSLHTIILSRIDQLSEQEKTTLRVASIVGRLFRARWLTGYYPELGEAPRVKATLEALESLDITPLDSPEPELAYLFKHIVTHEVTYESLSLATRAWLHEQLAAYLETAGAPMDTIAYHYGQSNNTSKKLEYFQKAAEAEQRIYANQDAIRDYRRAIALLQDPEIGSPSDAARLHEHLGDVLHWTGQYGEARAAFLQAAAGLPASEWIDQARLHRKIGNSWRDEHSYQEALQVYRETRDALDQVPMPMGELPAWWQEWIQVMLEISLVHYWLGQVQEGDELRLLLEPAVEQHASPVQRAAYLQSRRWMEFRRNRSVATPEMISTAREVLAIYHETGSQAAIPAAKFGLGFVLLWHAEPEPAMDLFHESLKLAEQTGDISLQARCLCYLTIASRQCGQMEETRKYAERGEQVAALARMPEYIAMAKANRAWLAWRRDNTAAVLELVEQAMALWQQLPGGHASAPFQWLAYFPMSAAALEQENLPLAIQAARALLMPSRQRLPDELAGTLERAIQAWDQDEPGAAGDLLRRSLVLAQQMRYL